MFNTDSNEELKTRINIAINMIENFSLKDEAGKNITIQEWRNKLLTVLKGEQTILSEKSIDDIVETNHLDKIAMPNNNEKTVRLIHLGTWYKCYDDDAKIISFITDYKLFEDSRRRPSVGFPKYSIEKVEDILIANKINYVLINDDNKVHDFGIENKYDNFLFNDLPFSYVVNGEL